MLKRVLLALLLAVPAVARAQNEQPDKDKPDLGGEPLTDPLPVDDDASANDNPDEPDAATTNLGDEPATRVARKRGRYTKKNYPLELIKRPLTLARRQAEITFDVPFVFDAKTLTQVLRADYGVTQDFQLGLTYSFGLETLSPSHFEAGKAFSLDCGYTIVPGWLSVVGRLPMYVDPFAMGVTLGVPFRVPLVGKWALHGGHDLVAVRIHRFPVDAADPAYNLGALAATRPGFGKEPDANLNINFGAIYQAKPNVGVYGTMAYRFPDLSTDDQPISLFVGATWAKSRKLDFGARAGCGRLDDVGATFTLALYTAYRL